MTSIRQLAPILLVAAVAVQGCSAVAMNSFRFDGAPQPPRTNASQVEILREPPLRRYVRLGRVDATPQRDDIDSAQLEAALRAEAAKMGANAVIINFEGQLPAGASIHPLPDDSEPTAQASRVVVGTAIRFVTE